MKTLILIAVLSLSFFTHAQSEEVPQELKAFASDFCSKWPEGQNEDPTQWADCCFAHDLNYWIGGTEGDRKVADKELRDCVKLSGASIQSFLMYIGVRIGGNPGDASYAWGYGWTVTKGYEQIKPEEIQTAKTLLENSEYNQDETKKVLIKQFIDEILIIR